MNERELKEEIEKTYELRNITYQRLRVQNFWTRILEIYYSVFTALLSVCGIMKNGEFISQHSVCFTVAVAILVCFANAQNFSGRAHDLEANLADLLKLKNKANSLKVGKKQICVELYKEYIKKCGDSEYHSIIDEYKYNGDWKYKFVVVLAAIFVIVLLLLPVVYVAIFHRGFYSVFRLKY